MYGILCISDYKDEQRPRKNYVKSKGKIFLLNNLEVIKELTQWYNNNLGKDLNNIKVCYKTVDYTTGSFVE